MTTPLLNPAALDPSPFFCIKLSNNDFTSSQIILESQAARSAQASEGKGRLGGGGGGGGGEDTQM